MILASGNSMGSTDQGLVALVVLALFALHIPVVISQKLGARTNSGPLRSSFNQGRETRDEV